MTEIYTLANLLSPAECEDVRGLFPPPSTGNVISPKGSVSALPARSSRVSRLITDGGPIIDRVRAAMLRANELLYHFEITGTEAVQLAEYGVGDHYRWHLDLGPGGAAMRKVSATVQLSDPGDYAGGDLEIFGADAISRDQGSIVVFPSFLLHRVAPVSRGIRRSLVAWALGEAPFR